MSLTISQKKNLSVIILRLKGSILSNTISGLAKKLEKLKSDKFKTIVIDLSEATFIDSYGLGVFVYSWKMMEECKKSLMFLCPDGFIRELFLSTNLHKILPLIDSIESI